MNLTALSLYNRGWHGSIPAVAHREPRGHRHSEVGRAAQHPDDVIAAPGRPHHHLPGHHLHGESAHREPGTVAYTINTVCMYVCMINLLYKHMYTTPFDHFRTTLFRAPLYKNQI